jgi:hypothetical protein
MILPLLVLQFQTTPPPAPAPVDDAGRGDKPVHVWLGSPSPLTRGAAVRVYVQVATDGNLVVLQRRTDGRIGVLFPTSPTGGPSVRAGTYEIHGPGQGAALVVAEPDGEGMILAALATDPMQFDEFARQADWNPDALVASWSGADAEGALSDIVQRMLGDGTFNYDLVTYTVAPAVYAQQDSTPQYAPYSTCLNCTFIGTEFVAAAPFVGCDDFTGVCFGFPRFHRRFERREPAVAPPRSVLALNLGPQAMPVAVPRDQQRLIPKGTHATPVIEPRPRPQVLAAEPTPAPAARPSVPAPRRHVRYTRLSAPAPIEDASRGGVTVVAPGAVAVARGVTATVATRPRTAVWATASSIAARGVGAAGGAGAIGAAGATSPASVAAPAGAQTLALPHAAWHAGGARTVVARGGARRH